MKEVDRGPQARSVPRGGDKVPTRRGEAKGALLAAASAEFNEKGFDETNSNEIARRAGFAPQTFYRHFDDKTAIFIAVYEAWKDKDLRTMETVGSVREAVGALVRSHTEFKLFRRSLRRLAIENPAVRQARTRARHEQLMVITRRFPALACQDLASRLAILMTVERLCDALAEGEFADLDPTSDTNLQKRIEAEIAAIFLALMGSVGARAALDPSATDRAC
ncbi:MAG: TetR/AcrR family transcriptional regulator [Methylobacterium sp.]|nr:TetR/AcrR family transcriptional regulator [Methylobacterium sp.]